MKIKPWLTVLLAGSLAGVGAVGADAVAPKPETMVLLAQRTLMSAPANPAVGSGFVAGGDLLDEQGGVKVGEGYSHCGVTSVTLGVPPAVTAHCTSVYQLSDGELHLSGMRRYTSITEGFEDTSVAVVGGTGRYATARGEGKVTRAVVQRAVGYRFEFTFVLD